MRSSICRHGTRDGQILHLTSKRRRLNPTQIEQSKKAPQFETNINAINICDFMRVWSFGLIIAKLGVQILMIKFYEFLS